MLSEGVQGGEVWGDTPARRAEWALPRQGHLSHPSRINDGAATAEGVLGSGDSRCKGKRTGRSGAFGERQVVSEARCQVCGRGVGWGGRRGWKGRLGQGVKGLRCHVGRSHFILGAVGHQLLMWGRDVIKHVFLCFRKIYPGSSVGRH